MALRQDPRTAPRPQRPETATAEPSQTAPRLANGVELLGRFEGSGYREAPFMVRRPDGQMVQLPQILYLILERLDGRRSHQHIAGEVTRAVGRGLEPADVEMLIEKKLRPLGLLASPDGSAPAAAKLDPFLALKLRFALVPKAAVRFVAAVFRPLFWPPVILAVLAGLVIFDAWFFFDHGVAQSVRALLYQPLYLVMTFGIIVAAAAFHEIGHATACRYGGGQPGQIGAGVYLVWPAFYTDVTDSYRLGKGARLRTDLGGVYFHAIFILVMAGVYFTTGNEVLLIPVFLAHLEIFRQLLPIVRLDGYHVLADVTGVPDLFNRIRPILVSLVPWKRSDARAKELKPWVRFVVTLWVLVFIPFLAFNVAWILVYAPRIAATGWDSFRGHLGETTAAFGRGAELAGSAGLIRLLMLGLPAAGMAYALTRGATRLTRGTVRATAGKPVTRSLALIGLLAVAGGVGFVWWPDGDYRPIRPGERWTAPEAATAVVHTASGRPVTEAENVPLTERRDSGPDDEVSRPAVEREATPEPSPATVTPTPTPSPTPVAETSPTPTPSPTTASPTPTVEPSP
ncbi:MAG TPA: hypothetical protein VG602_08335 [Actinomycetota bacterium]|nr:hypothetical protein [Actinomycetota bacterium]